LPVPELAWILLCFLVALLLVAASAAVTPGTAISAVAQIANVASRIADFIMRLSCDGNLDRCLSVSPRAGTNIPGWSRKCDGPVDLTPVVVDLPR
jgi:hypothetical protein